MHDHVPFICPQFGETDFAKVLSPAAEAFRYAVLENAGPCLRAHDAALLGVSAPA